MKTIFAFCLGALGVVYLKDPESLLTIDRISVGIERTQEKKTKSFFDSRKNHDKMKTKKARKPTPEQIERWREKQDRATERLLNR